MTTVANNAFAASLLHHLADTKPGENVFVSPYSVKQAVLLAGCAAAGETQTQILRVLREAENITDASVSAQTLRESLTPTDAAYEWLVANAVWTRAMPKEAYQNDVAGYFAATAHPLTTAQAVNDWASDATQKQITQIVTEDDIRRAEFVCTNAVYFKGTWETAFDPEMTAPQTFHGVGGDREQPFLMRRGKVLWCEGANYEAVCLPYRGGVSMVIVLPDETIGANALASALSVADWKTMRGGFRNRTLALALPRFEIRYRTDVLPPLTALGMPTQGDFSGVADSLRVGVLSAVLHETVLRVDEKGTTAAAVTAVVMERGGGSPPRPHVFIVDRPFLCAITHDATGTILFAGIITDPAPAPQ